MTRARGFTLIEMLVSLVVLSLVMSAAVWFFRGVSRAVAGTADRMDAMRNLRFAVSTMDRELRNAGAGTTEMQPTLVFVSPSVVVFNADIVSPIAGSPTAVNYDPDVNPNAANALLKGLEEPPAGAVFLLVSHRPSQLLPTIRSRCVALPVPIPPRELALQWLASHGVKNAERWLAYAGGAPLQALECAGKAEILERLLQRPLPVDDRDELEALAEALQKIALDRALASMGLPPKYQTGSAPADRRQARAWLAYARQMGQHRLLTGHPLNPKLFSAEMIAGLPRFKASS